MIRDLISLHGLLNVIASGVVFALLLVVGYIGTVVVFGGLR